MRVARWIQAACLLGVFFCSVAAPAPVTSPKRTYDGKCGAPVKSPEDAMAKADFVIEGVVTMSVLPNGADWPLLLSIDERKVVRERKPTNKNIKTMTFTLGPCFAQGLHPFTVKGSESLNGKRLRFFGNEHEFTTRHRLFYMQSADLPLPVEPNTGRPWGKHEAATNVHGNDVKNPIGDGWHRARSTDGKFSVELPGPYLDANVEKGGVQSYLLRTTDEQGSMFLAAFEPSRIYSPLAGSFDNEMKNPETVRLIFKGMPAVKIRNVTDAATGAVMHAIWVRVPGGTYAFAVATSKENEAQSVEARERFYNSIVFE